MIIIECETDKTISNEAILTATDVEKMRSCEHPKKVDERWNDNFQEDEAYH